MNPTIVDAKLSKRLQEIGAHYVVVDPVPRYVNTLVAAGLLHPKDARAMRRALNRELQAQRAQAD